MARDADMAVASTDRAGRLPIRRDARRIDLDRRIYLFVLPAVLLLALFNYYPFLSAFYHSLFDWDGVNARFVGLGNFRAMLSDEMLTASVPNILILTGMGVFFALTLPLIAAAVIYNLPAERSRLVYRFFFTVPLVIPWVVTVLVWQFLYDPIDGPINGLLTAIGLPGLARAWLSEPTIAIYAVGMIGGGGTGVGFPFVAGLNLLIYLAGLDSISREIVDAARLDGAGTLQRFFRIELPLIKGQIRMILVLTMITQIQSFQTIILLTRGGPGYATMVPGMAMYQDAFEFGRMGYASAIGVVLFIVMLLITLVTLNRLRSSVEAEPA
jgi:raffinose/stachyose/melibiose transport system permease protein